MTNSEILIAKRLVREMDRISKNAAHIAADAGMDSPNHHETMHFYMGIGLTLAIVFEELTGKEARNLKPQELMQWAKDLPMPEKRMPLQPTRFM